MRIIKINLFPLITEGTECSLGKLQRNPLRKSYDVWHQLATCNLELLIPIKTINKCYEMDFFSICHQQSIGLSCTIWARGQHKRYVTNIV